MDVISNLKTRIFLASIGVGIVSGCTIPLAPNNALRYGLTAILGASISSLVVTELVTSKAILEASKTQKQLNNDLRAKDADIYSLQRSVDSKSVEIKQLNNLRDKLVQINQDLQATLQDKELAIEKTRKEVSNLKNELQNVTTFSNKEIGELVTSTYERQIKKLEGLIGAYQRNYPNLEGELELLVAEIEKFKLRYRSLLDEYSAINSFDEILDTSLNLQERIIERCTELRLKAQSIIIKYLASIADNAVHVDFYQATLNSLLLSANTKIEENQKAIATEWIASNEDMVSRYETEFSEVLDTAKYSVSRMEQLNLRIEELENQLKQLKKPMRFNGTIDYAIAGNAVIDFYYKNYGYILDAIDWQETELGYKLVFSQRRNGNFLTVDKLHEKENREQIAGITNALKMPEFDISYQNGCVYLEVVLRKPQKVKSSPDRVNKLWVPAANFEKIVKKFKRIRITGGSESGKSPTAENIAICMLLAKNTGVRFYNPRHDSTKNYWSIPADGVSHQDSRKGIKELADLVRSKTKNLPLFVFDEIDNTLVDTEGKKQASLGRLINFILKESSHDETRVIFVGQNANVTNYPGMDRSDWNNAVNIHIGDNCYEAITNSNQFTANEQQKLKEKADEIKRYCQQQNEELGLDNSDSNAYRFCFVVEPGKQPYFMELPNFGSYSYDLIPSVDTEISSNGANTANTASNASNADSTVAANTAIDASNSFAAKDYIGTACPKCDNGTLTSYKSSRGIKYYNCNTCKKSTSENILKSK